MAGESEETERSREGVREWGCEKKWPRALPMLHFSRSGWWKTFSALHIMRLITLGQKGEERKKIRERVRRGGVWKCASGRLLWNSAKVRWCFRRTCLSLFLYSPNILLHRRSVSPRSEARTAVDWRLCNYMLMACWLAASLCGDIMLAHKVQRVDSTYQWASVTEHFERQRNGYLSMCWQCDWNSIQSQRVSGSVTSMTACWLTIYRVWIDLKLTIGFGVNEC